jgi:hypothetical protein
MMIENTNSLMEQTTNERPSSPTNLVAENTVEATNTQNSKNNLSATPDLIGATPCSPLVDWSIVNELSETCSEKHESLCQYLKSDEPCSEKISDLLREDQKASDEFWEKADLFLSHHPELLSADA